MVERETNTRQNGTWICDICLSKLCCNLPAVCKGRGPDEKFECCTWACWQKLVLAVPIGTNKEGLSSG